MSHISYNNLNYHAVFVLKSLIISEMIESTFSFYPLNSPTSFCFHFGFTFFIWVDWRYGRDILAFMVFQTSRCAVFVARILANHHDNERMLCCGVGTMLHRRPFSRSFIHLAGRSTAEIRFFLPVIELRPHKELFWKPLAFSALRFHCIKRRKS